MEIDVTKCDYYFMGRCSVSSHINYSLGCNDNDCYYKQLQQLKAENEKLKQDLQKESDLGHKAICEEMESFFKVMKLEKCLDEIEEIAKDKLNEGCSIRNKDCDFSCNKCLLENLNKILQLIKQAKEGE